MRANLQVRVSERARTGLLWTSHWAQARMHRRTLGALSAQDEQIISNLSTEGVHVTSVQQLLPDLAPKILDSMSRAAACIAKERLTVNSPSLRRSCGSTDLHSAELLRLFPDVYLLGLDPRIIRLAEHYLGLPVAYHGTALRQSLTDGNEVGARLWHMDSEDFHVLRVVIYFNDVTPGGGPFEYIPRNSGLSYKAFPGPESITSERMRKVVEERRWKQIYGPIGTVVIADSAKIFHHESLQLERDRTVAMLGYSSRRPRGMQLAMAHFPVESLRPALLTLLSPENHPHVFGWRRPGI
jgi:hypothetical protein